ncbi:methylase of polypeptide subunit release factors [Clostridium beijerinckii]|nr:methylase of polypeptide subunit release factors [Clostridium beijerinckii]
MNNFKLFQLKYRIFLRKSILNKMLCILSPRNKIVIRISQNLDKHIVAYYKNKKIYEVHNSKQLYSVSKSF